jgi:hypothetical protein
MLGFNSIMAYITGEILWLLENNLKFKTGAGSLAQAVECLLSKHEALSSNPTATK